MSPHQQVALGVSLGGGWVARLAEFPDTIASIVLVTVERGQERRRLRLDLGKRMFLDEPPQDLDARAAGALTGDIVQQVGPDPVNPRR